jgi:hypothetical protein
MIRSYLLTSSIRRLAPVASMRLGDVCPDAGIFGGAAAGGRAP